ncbi:hypothetical protein NX794_24780 [Streptomyces sp. LP11]|uniref:Uncharacterized protein n=1 Tax=Streptomyces pyxinicus TaxID=2970331 RepID=A0ABT2B7A0_9ACTN|nr:hypothetical protein [Streptomyces sp. LP11]MCS0604403.1 hypothetical protein [Streptomyces sp. LP11]
MLRRLSQVPTAHGLPHAKRRITERYGDLVRPAYLVLPVSLSRHRRVLPAHALVQRSLPAVVPRPPAPREAAGHLSPTSRSLHVPVLREVLALFRRPVGWPRRVPPPRLLLLPRLPVVWGLRLLPRAGGADELVPSRALSELSATARAAFVLLRVEGRTGAQAREALQAAGCGDAEAVETEGRCARRLDATLGVRATGALASQEFDPCTLRARPGDLLRRRRRVRLSGAAVLALLITVVTLVVCGGVPAGSGGVTGAGTGRVSGTPSAVGSVVRVAPGAWTATSRVDFTAWPPRGERTGDRALLRRALATWAGSRNGTRIGLSVGTSAGPPARAPQLLYAGEADGRTVVLLYDGRRLARYSESAPLGERSLTLARVDDADVTTAAAVALVVRDGAVRYLLAPWVAESGTRDVLRPDVPARPLGVGADGLTAPVPVFGAGGDCGRGPVLHLRSSSRIAEHHAFLLAGLGDLTPVHLTYTPLPAPGAPPREATGPAALLAWARLGCSLNSLRGRGVKAVNAWDFARQRLPDGAGDAVWTCSRADTWRGPGDVTVSLRTVGASGAGQRGRRARAVARPRATGACGRGAQRIVVHTNWRSPKGSWYVLAAASRAVNGLAVTGDVTASGAGPTLAVRAGAGARVLVRTRTDEGPRVIDLSSGVLNRPVRGTRALDRKVPRRPSGGRTSTGR